MPEKPTTSALEQLYTDAGELDIERVVNVLKQYVSIQRNDHKVFFSQEGHALKNDDKMLTYCLVKKMLAAEGVVESEGVSGKEIHEVTEIPKGTVDPAVQKLKKGGLLVGSGSSYQIPNRRVVDVLDRLEK
jgi:predicted transcriptional regulator